ncbi:HEAT repeat domain-containing protein [Streptomyces niveus]|uniref:HEAT repeat domain-containing protein n=1 Tax=Streptomyces niveus TaxID=193462 RepID=A0ABZ1ZZN1_STRNV|nr:HEAT repeat domain-containing protein [Streptomyces niveus]
MALDAADAIRQLQDRSSAKRRSAAKQLRKLGDQNAGPALLEALKNEVRDSRTWETQYQMTMALGTCGSPSDLPYLRDLVLQRETPHAVHTAGGDAIVRLS